MSTVSAATRCEIHLNATALLKKTGQFFKNAAHIQRNFKSDSRTYEDARLPGVQGGGEGVVFDGKFFVSEPVFPFSIGEVGDCVGVVLAVAEVGDDQDF